jgi:hypothetical protein
VQALALAFRADAVLVEQGVQIGLGDRAAPTLDPDQLGRGPLKIFGEGVLLGTEQRTSRNKSGGRVRDDSATRSRAAPESDPPVASHEDRRLRATLIQTTGTDLPESRRVDGANNADHRRATGRLQTQCLFSWLPGKSFSSGCSKSSCAKVADQEGVRWGNSVTIPTGENAGGRRVPRSPNITSERGP